ncbi:M12 family metallo-peptidase [Empedobacter sp. GD03861]|uniref:zinc-dependent metalloprotease n=1 Tax=Empedobacter sp. GD03861 TaxID=2975390 RepID=UPI00244CD70A|nr:zinc-dependent metalloprotease family protein [Empedobacter sp. GD03861]MDH0673939.1 M12 family metallo-peptidase [Empedobacter sp. GD03861]
MKSKFIILSLLIGGTVFAQKNHWHEFKNKNFQLNDLVERSSTPKDYKLFKLDIGNLIDDLNNTSNKGLNQSKTIYIPNENGELTKYIVEEASIMAPKLQEKFKTIKSYVGKSTDGKSTVRFSYSPSHGFSAMIHKGYEISYIDAYTEDLSTYISYSRKNVDDNINFICHTDDVQQQNLINQVTENFSHNRTVVDGKMRKYRLALATTVEYSRYHINRSGATNGTDEEKLAVVLSAINVAMTRVNGVYEKEFGVTMELVEDNDKILFITDDEYTNNDGEEMLSENQKVIDEVIGIDNYDIGHVFSTGGGGVAYLRSPCSTDKAGGVTGLGAPINDPFYIDYVAHEMGHQFGAPHTFNNSCSGNRSGATAVEPGSGSTIMAYAGICPPNVQNNSDPYFSTVSVSNIYNFVTSTNGSCSVNSDSGNNEPVIVLDKLSYNIPHSTAFVLEATASDPDGDAITYNWEQTDTQIATQPPVSTNKNGPTFRSLNPTTVGYRYFPNLQSIVDGKLTLETNPAPMNWEVIPSVARTLKFSLLVRDNNPKGGQTDRKNVVLVTKDFGPFKVTSQATTDYWTQNYPASITWDVAGTDANGIDTQNVKILLSVDGGKTFDYVLAESVPNNGKYDFTVPTNVTLTKEARIMIKAIDNVFLAVNAANFEISDKLATSEINSKDLATISPNPSNGIINLDFTKSFTSGKITVTDLAGRTVYSNTLNSSKSQQVNLSNLSNGVYIVSIEAGNEQFTKKVIIKK